MNVTTRALALSTFCFASQSDRWRLVPCFPAKMLNEKLNTPLHHQQTHKKTQSPRRPRRCRRWQRRAAACRAAAAAPTTAEEGEGAVPCRAAPRRPRRPRRSRPTRRTSTRSSRRWRPRGRRAAAVGVCSEFLPRVVPVTVNGSASTDRSLIPFHPACCRVVSVSV